MDIPRQKDTVSDIAKRASLFKVAPVKAMEARGWIAKTRSFDELQQELRRFYGTDRLDDIPPIKIADRTKAKATRTTLASLQCWAHRAMQLARTLRVPKFDKKTAKSKLAALRSLATKPEGTRKVPQVLVAMGIRFVIVENLPKTKIDGASLRLDQDSPIIAMSLRYERIDYFWFTLMHELSHVFNDEPTIDVDIEKKARKDADSVNREARADKASASMLLSQDKLESFIRRVGPFYSRSKIDKFADRMHIHPGIIVGQLQHRGALKYWADRDMLVPVRYLVLEEATTDGWGRAFPFGNTDSNDAVGRHEACQF